MKLSVSAYRAQASAHKKILSNYQHQLSYGATNQASSARTPSDPATFLTGFKGLSAKCGSSDVSILWIVRRTRRAREGVVCRRLRRAAAVLPVRGWAQGPIPVAVLPLLFPTHWRRQETTRTTRTRKVAEDVPMATQERERRAINVG